MAVPAWQSVPDIGKGNHSGFAPDRESESQTGAKERRGRMRQWQRAHLPGKVWSNQGGH